MKEMLINNYGFELDHIDPNTVWAGIGSLVNGSICKVKIHGTTA